MKSAIELVSWLAELAGPGAAPERADALRDGNKLWQHAAAERQLDPDESSRSRLARWLVQLRDDGWITWSFQLWPGEASEPAAAVFGAEHLERCTDFRLTPEGWRALPGVRSGAAAAAPSAEEGVTDSDSGDVFISHAGEDKDAVARPLALELERRGWTVWFDEFELTIGDGLRSTIDRGLTQSRFGIVVLSPHFFTKPWPQRELDGLVAREMTSGGKVVLPIWHGVDAEYVARYSPPLADRLAASTSLGIAKLADEIERALRSDHPTRRAAPPSDAPPPLPVFIQGPNPVLEAVMGQNQAALREVLRQELSAYTAGLNELLGDRWSERPTPERAAEAGEAALPYAERLASQLLPLIEHGPDLFGQQLRLLARSLRRPPINGFPFWHEVKEWCAWWLVHVLGSYAVRREAFGTIAPMFTTRVPASDGRTQLLGQNFLPKGLEMIGDALAAPPPGQKWISPNWEHLVRSVDSSEALRTGWPELFETTTDPRQALSEWSFVHCLGLGLRGQRSLGYWSLSGETTGFARTLRDDEGLRERLARGAFSLSLTELDQQAREALGHVHAMGPFGGDTTATEVLLGRE